MLRRILPGREVLRRPDFRCLNRGLGGDRCSGLSRRYMSEIEAGFESLPSVGPDVIFFLCQYRPLVRGKPEDGGAYPAIDFVTTGFLF